MGNLLWELLRGADRAAQIRVERWIADVGSRNTPLLLTLTGAWVGGLAMLAPYACIAFLLSRQIHVNDSMLMIFLLMLYVLMGIAQGAWLGAACGLSVALTVQKQRYRAGVVCWVGSLPYMSLLAWFFYTAAYAHRDAAKLLILMCGLPLLWAGVLLLAGARLLSKP